MAGKSGKVEDLDKMLAKGKDMGHMKGGECSWGAGVFVGLLFSG